MLKVNFAPTLCRLFLTDHMAAVESGARRLSSEYADYTPVGMGVLDSETCKGAEKQLNKGPEDSAEELRGLEDEVIPQTDKGNATIVMRRCNYDRRWHWRWHQPDPGCGRAMLVTLSASSGRAQLKNSFDISMGSGQPSSSLWGRTTRYSGKDRMAAWMSLSTGNPCTRTGVAGMGDPPL